MKQILLTRGMSAMVDDGDYAGLSVFNWHLQQCKGLFYAARNVQLLGKRTKVYMHQVLALALGAPQVDHHDRNGLNNQRFNLRPCTVSQNNANRRGPEKKTSRFRGVCWHESAGKWMASISVMDKNQYLGCYTNEEQAARVYDKAASAVFGKFALLNYAPTST